MEKTTASSPSSDTSVDDPLRVIARDDARCMLAVAPKDKAVALVIEPIATYPSVGAVPEFICTAGTPQVVFPHVGAISDEVGQRAPTAPKYEP